MSLAGNERLWLIQSGWQPVSDGWVMPAGAWGVEELAKAYGCWMFDDADALEMQSSLLKHGLVSACPEEKKPEPKPEKKPPKPKPLKRKVYQAQREMEEFNRISRREHWIKVTGLPPPEDRGFVPQTKDAKQYGSPCLTGATAFAHDCGRRVNRKPILDDSSPWSENALRDWEDGEMDL